MKSRDILDLVLRLAGVIFLYKGLDGVSIAIANFCPIFPHLNFRSLFPSIVLVGCPLAIGWYLFKGAPWLMQQAYPDGQSGPTWFAGRQPKPEQGPVVTGQVSGSNTAPKI
jgi:hypothetical protein